MTLRFDTSSDGTRQPGVGRQAVRRVARVAALRGVGRGVERVNRLERIERDARRMRNVRFAPAAQRKQSRTTSVARYGRLENESGAGFDGGGGTR